MSKAAGKFSSSDVAIPSGVPKGFAGERQADGTPTTQFTPPQKRQPGQYSLADRSAVPDRPSDSGMESAMQAHADKMHPPSGAQPMPGAKQSGGY